METYVVSFFGNGECSPINGVYGVFDSFALAMEAVQKYCQEYDEKIINVETRSTLYIFYTDKGKYVIEEFTMNDTEL